MEYGAASGWPCILGHGFPYDVHVYDRAAPILAQVGARVIVPYLRGYGPTRFLKAETPRSGEQAALGVDLLDFMDALKIRRAVLGGYDWGGRAACIVAALLPSQVVALVSGNSYNIQSIAYAMEPASPVEEAAFWYQYYFHNERGRRGLTKNRREIARLLWRMWSPMGVRRCDLRSNGERLRQSRLRRGRHPFLPASLRARARRRRSLV
jgi:pimeloyl-ACP methyl ester carboxylesterase